MLEHLRVGPLKRTKVPNDSDDSNTKEKPQEQQQQQDQQPSTTNDLLNDSSNSSAIAKGNGAVLNSVDEFDNSSRISVVINDTRKRSLKEIPNGLVNVIDADKKYDPRKRYSISNGDLRGNNKSRELSPTPRMIQQQRKLSADMRARGSNSQLNDDYLMRRPVRLKSMCTNFEVYDSLHTKAMDVSILVKYLTCFSRCNKYYIM